MDEIVYRPIKSDATRMAALVTGEIDFVLDPPLQDIAAAASRPAACRIIEGPENRVIFLVMDQKRDELKYSNVKGKNPLKDLRVRQALYHGDRHRGDPHAGDARHVGCPTGVDGAGPARRAPPTLEPRLLALRPGAREEAARRGGLSRRASSCSSLCPNNRYVNDERICTALAAMFAQGRREGVASNCLPRAQFFQKVDQFDFAMHLYGWGGARDRPGLHADAGAPRLDGKGKGDFNSGGSRTPSSTA